MTDTLHLNRPSTSPSIGTGELETSHLPSRPVNLSQTLKVFCGSSPLGKPSLFESQGLGAYEYCDIRESKKDSNQVDILVLDRPERESNV